MIEIDYFQYNPADLLGTGAFAIVYKGCFKDDSTKKVAIKMIKKNDNIEKTVDLISKEIAVLKKLNHENIVRLYSHNVTQSNVYLMMEYCNGGDLQACLNKCKTLSEDTIQHFLIQIGSAMEALNSKGIVHRDLKPGNILLTYPSDTGQMGSPRSYSDMRGVCFKLADFGFARFLQDGMMAMTMCGSPMYMAPEVLMSWKYNALADVWSMGVIVFQCLTGKPPFYAQTPDALKMIYVKSPVLQPQIPNTTSPLLQDLLLRMLVRNPNERIDYNAFLRHEFLQPKVIITKPVGPRGSIGRSNSVCEPLTSIPIADGARGHVHPYLCPTKQRVAQEPSRPTQLDLMGLIRGRTRTSSVPNVRPPGRSQASTPLQGVSWPEEDEQLDDFVIVNADGSVSEGNRDQPLTSEEARQLFDADSNSTDESLDANTDFRQHLRYPEIKEIPRQRKNGSENLVRPASTGKLKLFNHASPLPYQRPVRYLSENVDLRHSPSTSPSSVATFYLGRPACHSTCSSGAGTPTSPSSGGFHRLASRGGPLVPAIPEHVLGGVQRRLYPVSSELCVPGTVPQRTAHYHNSPTRHSWGTEFAHVDLTRDRRYSTLPNTGLFPLEYGSGGRGSNQRLEIMGRTPLSDNIGIIDPALLISPPQLSDETLMEPEHNEEMRRVASVLDLCELLAELAGERSTPLGESTIGSRRAPFSPPIPIKRVADKDTRPALSTEDVVAKGPPLRFASESQRIVEQILLYKRILHSLEILFINVKKAFDEGKLKTTSIARKKLKECNLMYHRCYIRLSHLARDCRRNDISSEVAGLIKTTTADRLIFQYALSLCSAAELDEYLGNNDMSLRRYRASIGLLHSLYTNAWSPNDASQLSNYISIVETRYQKFCDSINAI